MINLGKFYIFLNNIETHEPITHVLAMYLIWICPDTTIAVL